MSAVGGHVIFVEFDLHPGTGREFLSHVTENAARSVADEPGCRRFDVLMPTSEANSVALYEIYDDEAAFEAHLATPHYQQFEASSAALVRAKRVIVYALREHAK